MSDIGIKLRDIYDKDQLVIMSLFDKTRNKKNAKTMIIFKSLSIVKLNK